LQGVKRYNYKKGTEMEIIREKIGVDRLRQMAEQMFGNLVKAVVDVEKRIMAVDGELHSDEEAILLQQGSKQRDLWGINIYPDETGDSFIEFDSMINIKPSSGNRTRGIDNPEVRKKISDIVEGLIEK
jgi:hypothetical protein